MMYGFMVRSYFKEEIIISRSDCGWGYKNWGVLQVKRKVTIVITTALTVLLSTSVGVISSKAEEIVKNNVYIASQETAISKVTNKEELAKQAEASKQAQIVATKAKQEEIDRIAIERKDTSKQAQITKDYKKAKAESDKIESASLAAISGNNQTVTGLKLSNYLKSAANISSVLNRAVVLHGGDASNLCVYFSSEAMRRIGVAVPKSTCTTGEYLSYLRTHAWIPSYNIKELTPGSICFTTPGLHGYNPTHTFVFMGWVTAGNYSLAYVADNQGNSVHVRNMGVTKATEAFGLFMHTPTPPEQITAAPSSYNSINIKWSSVNEANGYEVYKATSSKAAYTLISRTAARSYNNTYITTNNNYYYKVRAYRMSGSVKVYSGFSTTVSSKPILAAPTSVKAASSSYNSINISWNAVSGANGYEVYKATSSKAAFTLLPTTSARNYNNTYITTNNNYYYKVRAYRLIGPLKVYSGFSTIINAKPIPTAPTSVKATSSSYNSINTSWSTVTGADGYEVYSAKSSSGSYTLILETTAKSYNNTGITTNSTYYYKVRAYRMVENVKVYSYLSSIASSKPVPSSPTNVKATRTSPKSIKLTWSNAPGANGYEVFKATSSNGTYSLLSRMESLYCTNSRLTTGKTYYYKIRSYRTVGNTRVYGDKWSAVVHAKA